jgi:cell division protein FtsB
MGVARKSGGGAAARAGGGRTWGRRIFGLAVLGGAVYFAVQGGEFSTFDLLHQRNTRAALVHDVGALQHTVDSLAAWKKAIETDPGVQERIAREDFGMVRGNKELLYRFVEPRDTTRR